MEEQNWKDMESKYYMHAANRYPMVIEKGEGTKRKGKGIRKRTKNLKQNEY